MIRKYVQGENRKTDRELFGIVGSLITLKEVHVSLGMPVTSLPCDIWHVYTVKDNLLGFIQTRILKNKKAHVRYIYSDKADVQSALIKAVLDMAKEMELYSVFTNDRSEAKIWKEMKFTKHKKHLRSSFLRWEIILEEKK